MGDEPVDHPLPQALGTSAYSLPAGDVCAACNAYLSDLDQNFCNHHHLAGMIVFGQVPGTKNRTRISVAPDLSFDPARHHLAMTGGRGTFEDGVLTMRADGNTRFDNWKFSRGLHRIALGVLALSTSASIALEAQYDSTRKYVRSPQGRSEFRTYLQRPSDRRLGNRTLPVALRQQGYRYGFWQVGDAFCFYLNLFVSEFIVAFWGEPADLREADRHSISVRSCPTGTPLSRRPWLTFTRAGEGRRIELTPDIFDVQKGGDDA